MKDMKQRVTYMDRLLNFAQADLATISMMARREWANEMSFIIAGPSNVMFSYPKDPEKPKEWEKVLSFQREWLLVLQWLVGHLHEEWVINVDLPAILCWGPTAEQGEFSLVDRTAAFGEKIKVERAQVKHPGSQAAFSITTPEDMSFPPGAVNFFRALSGFPTSSLLRCAYCGKIFFNPTKRKKRYCTPTCQNAAGVQRFREKKGG